MPSSGSISSPASGATARAAASASAGAGTAEQHVAGTLDLRDQLRLDANSPSRATSGAAFTSALSAIAGIDACPLRPCTRRRNGELIFSAVEQR